MSHSPAELEARLRLICIPQLGPRRHRRLLAAFGCASSALSAPASAWHALGLPEVVTQARRSSEIRERAAAALVWLEKPGRQLLSLGTPEYPALLGELPDAPPLLFVEGDAGILEQPQLAIVGSRRASRAGLDTARSFARSLAGGGFVIGSGLALGIDGAAHQGALDAGGTTVAALGTGLACVYPRRHLGLAERIVEAGGALVSELLPDSAAQAANFPRRNRIISGLALGVLVVEASPQSGSLITARLAAEQGREVYAIPGSIHHPGARGCHQLLREGATLVESVEDILGALRGWQHSVASAAVAPPVASADPLLRLLRVAPASSESLAAHLGWSLAQVLSSLTQLELDDRVACEAGLWMVRPST